MQVAWTSYASRDEADRNKTPTLHVPELSEPDLIELQSLAKRESSKLAQRLSLFGADKQQYALIWSEIRSAFATLLKKGSALRAFQQLGGDTLERDPLRDALVRTLSLPTIDAERITAAVLTIESDDALGRDDFVRVLKFLQPVRSVLDFRTRLVQRFGTAEAGLDAFVERLGKGTSSKETLETVALGLGMGHQDMEAVFKQASVLGGGGGVTSIEILRVSVRHAHILQQLHLLEQYLGGPSSCQAWLNDRQNALATEVVDVLQPLGVSSNFCQQLVAMLRDRALTSAKAGYHLRHPLNQELPSSNATTTLDPDCLLIHPSAMTHEQFARPTLGRGVCSRPDRGMETAKLKRLNRLWTPGHAVPSRPG